MKDNNSKIMSSEWSTNTPKNPIAQNNPTSNHSIKFFLNYLVFGNEYKIMTFPIRLRKYAAILAIPKTPLTAQKL